MTKAQIKARLKRMGITQADLARQCNVAHNTISYFVRGKLVSKPLERKVAHILGISVAEFRGEKKNSEAA